MRNDDPFPSLPCPAPSRHGLVWRRLIPLGLACAMLAPSVPLRADGPHEAAELMGSWCDDTGYQLNLTQSAIWFRDLQAMEDPPAGADLAFAANIAVYTQDFRESVYPEIGLIACTLTLTGPDRAREHCQGPGVGFRPTIDLVRCPETPIS